MSWGQRVALAAFLRNAAAGSGSRCLFAVAIAVGAASVCVERAWAGGSDVDETVSADVPTGLVYTEDGAARGVLPYTMAEGLGAGMAAADIEGDGDVDLFVPTGTGQPNQLYLNTGDGSFTEIAQAAGLASTENARSALWMDADEDGLLDLFVLYDRYRVFNMPLSKSLRFYRQTAPGVFADETTKSGVAGFAKIPWTQQGSGMAAGDLVGDERPDLVVTVWGSGLRLFENLGGGQFQDVTVSAGLVESNATYWQPLIADLNDDGLQDIFVAHDFAPNRAFINDGNGGFVDLAPAMGLDNAFNEMGATLGDCDNDGDLDLYNTNLTRLFSGEYQYCVFFENLGAGIHQETAVHFGVDEGGYGWGTIFFDADLDGRQDLMAVNALEITGLANVETWDAHAKLWLNGGPQVGTPSYFESSRAAGVAFEDAVSSVISVDLDRDGDLDLLSNAHEGPMRVLESNATDRFQTRSWLTVRPRMPGTLNPRALGAVVRVVADGVERTRYIHAGTSFCGQEPAESHFGLGQADTVDSVRVEWPNGTVTVLTGVDSGQLIDVIPVPEGRGTPRGPVSYSVYRAWLDGLAGGR